MLDNRKIVRHFNSLSFIQFLAGHSLRGFAWYRLAVAAAFVAWWALR